MITFTKRYFALALLTLVLLPQSTFASYTISPLVIDRTVEKRDILTEDITLTNTSDSQVRIYPTVNEIAVTEGGTIENFVEPSMLEDRSNSVTAWIEISRSRIELAPGETRTIPLTIRMHPETLPGEYHAFIGFPRASNRPEAEALVAGGGVPGTVVTIRVDQVQNQFLRLEGFSVERFIKASNEGVITYELHNPGDDPVIPKGEVIFYDNNGNEVTAIPVNPEGTIIEGDARISFADVVPPDLGFGKYKAFLEVEYGEHQTASVHDTAFFYVLPLKWILIAFGVLLFLSIVIGLYVHKKYDLAPEEDDDGDSVAMFIRPGRSEGKDHDIDLSKKNTD